MLVNLFTKFWFNATMNSTPDEQSLRSIYCRICHEDGNYEELVDPCKCSGTVGLIHTSCLEKWLSTSNSAQCEICKYAFTIKKKNKPLPQSIWQWWMTKNGSGPQGICGDLFCFFILTPLCVTATYVCAISATAYTHHGVWQGTGLVILCCMLVSTYFLWLIVAIRFHYKSWRNWCRHNQNIKLLVKHRPLNMKDDASLMQVENNNNVDNSRRENPWYSRIFAYFGDPSCELNQTTSV